MASEVFNSRKDGGVTQSYEDYVTEGAARTLEHLLNEYNTYQEAGKSHKAFMREVFVPVSEQFYAHMYTLATLPSGSSVTVI